MEHLWTRGIGFVAIGLGACFAEESAQGADAIVDGDFESPSTPRAGLLAFDAGQAFSAWKVVGTGQVAIVGGGYVHSGIQFVAADGRQWLDLTGVVSNASSGVEQVVKTAPGQSYSLRFRVGNVVNPGAGFGSSSTVHVRVNGAHVMSATNSAGNAWGVSWKRFKLTIVPTMTHTTIAFINGDPSDDNSNGLDAVSLTPVLADDDD